MSQQTELTIIRKMPNIVSTPEIEKSIEKYFENVKNNIRFKEHELSDEEVEKKFSEMHKNSDFKEFIYVGDFIYYNTKDKSFWVEIVSNNFMSEFRELADEIGPRELDGKNSQVFLDVNMCDEIIRAAKYLLNKNYDEKIEECINSRFIKVFEDLCPAYMMRNRKDESLYFLEREMSGMWKFYKDTTAKDCEEDECMKYGETVLRELISVCGLYMHLVDEAEWRDNKPEYRLIYER